MLFDPKQGRPSLTSLIVRLEAEDPTTTYQISDAFTCLVATLYGDVIPFLSGYDLALANVIYDSPHTYGAALERAKKALGGN